MIIRSLWPDLPTWQPRNVHHLFFEREDQRTWNEDYELYIDARTGHKRTFAQFRRLVQQLATALISPENSGGLNLSSSSGDLVGIIGPNCMDYPLIVHACLRSTVPFALLSSYYTPHELSHGLQLAGVTRIFVHPSRVKLVEEAAKFANIPSNRIHLLAADVIAPGSIGALLQSLQDHKVPIAPAQPAVGDTLAYLIFSSGTSGLPKALMVNHSNMAYTMLQIATVMKATAAVITPPKLKNPAGIPVTLSTLPFHHTYGLWQGNFSCLMVPNSIVLIEKFSAELVLSSIPKYYISGIPLVPSLIHSLVHHPSFAKTDFSSILVVVSGAAHLPPELARKFMDGVSTNGLMPVLQEGYGMSEVTVSAIVRPRAGVLKIPVKPEAMGVLHPGLEARIVLEDGTDAAPGQSGELYIRGPTVLKGYWRNSKATNETFVDGWLRTGDHFSVDNDGYFSFRERLKDILKVSGMQVAPSEIENTLLEEKHKYINDVAVAGVMGGRTADELVPHAWIVLSNAGREVGEKMVKETLNAWLGERLSKYKQLRGGIEVVDEIPKSPSGKVLRRLLQESLNARPSFKTKL